MAVASRKSGKYSDLWYEFPKEPVLEKFVGFFKSNGYSKFTPPMPDTVYHHAKVLREARLRGKKLYSPAQYYDAVPQTHYVLFSDGALCYEVFTDIGVKSDTYNFSIYSDGKEALFRSSNYDDFRPIAIDHLKDSGVEK